MRSMLGLIWLGLLAVTLPAGQAVGIAGAGGDDAPAAAGADAYTAGVAAFERQDWQAVIQHMARVIEDRPWEDEAYNLSGFAWRKLGDYERALVLYDQALRLNPHNRGALAYLGEAYIELDRLDDAKAILGRLATECRRVVGDQGTPADCVEWQALEGALVDYGAGGS
jgi:tetratricopeptide (TPR) repeat protein